MKQWMLTWRLSHDKNKHFRDLPLSELTNASLPAAPAPRLPVTPWWHALPRAKGSTECGRVKKMRDDVWKEPDLNQGHSGQSRGCTDGRLHRLHYLGLSLRSWNVWWSWTLGFQCIDGDSLWLINHHFSNIRLQTFKDRGKNKKEVYWNALKVVYEQTPANMINVQKRSTAQRDGKETKDI